MTDPDVGDGAAFLVALGSLPDRWRYAFVMRRAHGWTVSQVAAGLGVTTQRASQLSWKAEARMRKLLDGRRAALLGMFEEAA